VARVLLAPLAADQRRRVGDCVPRELEPDEFSGHDAAVGQWARRRRTAVVPDGCRLAGRRVVRIQEVHVRRGREVRVEGEPEEPAVPVVVDSLRTSATTVGVVADRLGKTLRRPLFSATKTRPSGANRTLVGNVKPWNATVSEKPTGTAPVEAAVRCCTSPSRGASAIYG